jgi:hypothetical protein
MPKSKTVLPETANPLAAALGRMPEPTRKFAASEAPAEREQPPSEAGLTVKQETPRETARRQPSPLQTRLSFHVPEDLADDVRNTVIALSGPPHFLSMSSFAVAALRHEVERLAREFNNAKPFPRRAAEPRPGRRPALSA